MSGSAPGPNRRETEALMRRFFVGQPDVSSRSTANGTVFFTQDDERRRLDGTLFFAVPGDGGFLVRLRPEDQERFAQKDKAGRNVALPAWLAPIQTEFAMKSLDGGRHVQGEPNEWVWIHIEDEQSFNKRKPVLLESLAYVRHLLATLGV